MKYCQDVVQKHQSSKLSLAAATAVLEQRACVCVYSGLYLLRCAEVDALVSATADHPHLAVIG